MARKRPGQPTATSRPSDPTTEYAEAVAKGRRPDGSLPGEFEIAACKRHLDDLVHGHGRGLHWELDRAEHAINFFPAMLTITEGAKVGMPFTLLPWHVFAVGSIFGWRKTSGRMRFRSAWLETGKGQAKSPLMAGISIYMAGFYGVPRAKAFAIGQDRNTANVLFKDAVAMCRGPIPPAAGEEVDDSDTLENRGIALIRGEADNAWKVEFPDTGSLIQALANGEAVSGPKPILVAADEIHEFKANTSIETWKAAIAKMPGDAIMLLGTNTPASNQIVGTEYSEFYQKVAAGAALDDEAFSFIARVDEKDHATIFETPEVWTKSLPALGITFPRENIDGMVNTAKSMLSTALSTKRLYFGIPVGTEGFWISEEAWNAVKGAVDELALKGKPCWLSLDLSKKNDLTALSACWREEPKLSVKTWYWTTKVGLPDRATADGVPYERWVEKGFLTATPGAVIDYEFVAAQVQKVCAEQTVEFMAVDPAKIDDFIEACGRINFAVWKFEGPKEPKGEGLMLVTHGQGTRVLFQEKSLCMPRSIEKLEDAILGGPDAIVIDESPVTSMCGSNTVAIADAMNNRAFDKKRSRGRIDGTVTIAMAVGAAMNEFELAEKSFWESAA